MPPPAWQALKFWNEHFELACSGERYMPDWHCEIEWSRNAMHNLIDSPPLEDAQRLPKPELTEKIYDFHMARLRYISAAAGINRDFDISQEIEAETHACAVWGLIKTCQYGSTVHRRISLRNLREVLGPERYYAGDW